MHFYQISWEKFIEQRKVDIKKILDKMLCVFICFDTLKLDLTFHSAVFFIGRKGITTLSNIFYKA